ncbi:response regulator [Spongisporangium articulatum]|uniref:Response regulator n=1 Tax=Spongisporangium articulatum TaxID=3362603 RepID=A0ABW8AHB5_9ACTN
MIRVLVVDDEPQVRTALREILASAPDLRAEDEAGDGDEAVRVAIATRPDVVLMDVRMPRRDGLWAAAELLRRPQPPAVVMLTTFGERAYVDVAVAAGVSGFLLKTGGPDELIAAVRSVAAGGACLDPAIAADLLSEVRTARSRGAAARRARAGLTPREQEILTLLAEGLTNAELAQRLHLSEGTVKGYVSTLLARLGVRNRVEAAILGQQAQG